MSRTTQCPNCGVVLNVPEAAASKRLKCPKCGTKFQSGTPGTKPQSSAPGVDTAGPASTLLPTEGRPASGSHSTKQPHHDPDLPTAASDLRETFDAELLMGEDAPAKPKKPSKSAEIADASSLLADDDPPKRRVTAAEARSKPRRCPDCSYVVPAGMSLCARCGLDLDTGRRHNVIDEITEEAPPPPRVAGPPIGIALIGGVSLIVSLILTILSFMAYSKGQAGTQYLGLVSLYGVFAAVQFLRGKSVKLLMIALGLAAGIDVIALIALPLYNVFTAPPVVQDSAPVGIDPEDMPHYQNISQQVDSRTITWGIVILLLIAAAMVYLSTRAVRRHFERHRQSAAVPVT